MQTNYTIFAYSFRRGASALAVCLTASTLSFGQVKDLSHELAAALNASGVPGISVAIESHGRIAATGVAGFRRIGSADKITPADRFHLGSCTKRMTTLMIYRLIDQGKLRLTTTLAECLRGMPMREAYRHVTVLELLQFKGGIQPYLMISPQSTPAVFDARGSAEQQRRRFVAHVLEEPPVVKPGTKAVYSNADFSVLAYIASCATGQSWEQLMRKNVFTPLGLASAGFGRPRHLSRDEPSGHLRSGAGFEPEADEFAHPASLSAAGDVSSSMVDFVRFAAEEVRIARGKGRLLSSRASALMNRWSGLTEGRPVLGGAGAFTASMTVWPSRDCAVVAAVNCGGGEEVCERTSQLAAHQSVGGGPVSVRSGGTHRGYGFGLRLAPGGAVIIGEVAAGSVADTAGLAAGDEIVEINGVAIQQVADQDRFAALSGKTLALTVKRQGHLLRMRMTLDGA